MATKKLTVRGETVDYAIKTGLEQLGLKQEKTLIKILQKDSQSLFAQKEAIIAIIYDDEESTAALSGKANREFKSKFQFRFDDDQAQVQVPPSFYEEQYVKDVDERQQYLVDYLAEHEVQETNEDWISKIAEDYQCQYNFHPVKQLETIPLNNQGATIHLRISEDDMQCRAIIFHGEGTCEQEVFTVLKKQGIVKGIRRKNLSSILSNKYQCYFTLAEGEAPIDDQPGEVEKFFQEDEHKEFAKMMEMLTIDTRNIKDINIAERNQLLIHIGDVIKGTDGYTIKGEVVKREEISDSEMTIKCGQQVYCSDDGKEIFAKDSGHILWKRDENFIDVEPVYIVEGNVDYAEGNIHGFVGKVIIKGDVKPRFSVVAQGDVEVQGTVEDAIIKSTNGNVFIAQSVIHKKEGMVQAKETVHCFIATGAHLKGRNIIVEKEAMNSQIEAENEVIATGSPGVIIGGEVHCKSLLRANTIGSESCVPTKLHIGDVTEPKQKLRGLTQKTRVTAAKLKETEEIVEILSKKAEHDDLDSLQQGQLDKAKQEVPDLNDYLKYCEEQEESLKQEIQERRPAKLEILDTLHPHIDIFLFEGHLIPHSAEKHTGFSYRKGSIQRYPL